MARYPKGTGKPRRMTRRPDRKPLRTQHDGQGLGPCTPNCPGCKVEQDELDRLGEPPPISVDRFPRGAHHYDDPQPGRKEGP